MLFYLLIFPLWASYMPILFPNLRCGIWVSKAIFRRIINLVITQILVCLTKISALKAIISICIPNKFATEDLQLPQQIHLLMSYQLDSHDHFHETQFHSISFLCWVSWSSFLCLTFWFQNILTWACYMIFLSTIFQNAHYPNECVLCHLLLGADKDTS